MDYSEGGGGGKGYVAPPLKLLGGGAGPPTPLPTPIYQITYIYCEDFEPFLGPTFCCHICGSFND